MGKEIEMRNPTLIGGTQLLFRISYDVDTQELVCEWNPLVLEKIRKIGLSGLIKMFHMSLGDLLEQDLVDKKAKEKQIEESKKVILTPVS